jgi:predicted kinase
MNKNRVEFVICKGLPGSGKTTWAKTQVQLHKYTRVNRDDLREMVFNKHSPFSKEKENVIIALRDMNITYLLSNGKNVINDDTNLNPGTFNSQVELGEAVGAEVKVQDFTDVPLSVCLARNNYRISPVPDKVIVGMFYKHIWNRKDMLTDRKLEDAIVVDMDGTLTITDQRNPYGPGCEDDPPNTPVLELVHTLQEKYKIVVVSGRDNKYYQPTSFWLSKNNIKFDNLFLRDNGDTDKDCIVKRNIYFKHIYENYRVVFVLDDRNQTVEGWRELGLPCFQVREGNF